MANGNGSSSTHLAGDRLDDLVARHITVQRSAIRALEAEEAQLERAAVQRLRASQVTADHSAIGVASFGQGTIRQSSVGVVAAKSVACDEVHTLILASPVVRGEVHTWLDLRSAVAIGFGMALGRILIVAVRSMIRRLAK